MTEKISQLNTEKAILFLNGNTSKLTDIDKNISIFCTDGAYNHLHNTDLNICAVIGDFDSIRCDLPDNLAIHRPDQNYTDFEKALVYLMEKGFKEIDIHFGSGKEMDHFLCNLSVAKRFYKTIKLTFFDDYQKYFFIDKSTQLKDVEHKIISIMPFPKAVVSSLGLVYEMSDYVIELGKATSCRNKAKNNDVTINITSGLAIIFIEN